MSAKVMTVTSEKVAVPTDRDNHVSSRKLLERSANGMASTSPDTEDPSGKSEAPTTSAEVTLKSSTNEKQEHSSGKTAHHRPMALSSKQYLDMVHMRQAALVSKVSRFGAHEMKSRDSGMKSSGAKQGDPRCLGEVQTVSNLDPLISKISTLKIDEGAKRAQSGEENESIPKGKAVTDNKKDKGSGKATAEEKSEAPEGPRDTAKSEGLISRGPVHGSTGRTRVSMAPYIIQMGPAAVQQQCLCPDWNSNQNYVLNPRMAPFQLLESQRNNHNYFDCFDNGNHEVRPWAVPANHWRGEAVMNETLLPNDHQTIIFESDQHLDLVSVQEPLFAVAPQVDDEASNLLVSNRSPIAAPSPPDKYSPDPRHHEIFNHGSPVNQLWNDQDQERHQPAMDQRSDSPVNELPDDLSDFILSYSQPYRVSESSSGASSASSPGAETVMTSEGSAPSSRRNSIEGTSSGISSVSSPDCSVFSEHHSPPPERKESFDKHERPESSGSVSSSGEQETAILCISDETPSTGNVSSTTQGIKALRPFGTTNGRRAMEHFKSQIIENERVTGWAWAAKCWKAAPEALFYLRDKDGDTFLHRVVYHKDKPKIYGLVEHMLKYQDPLYQKCFDLPNNNNETPLFFAVERQLEDVVDYLLECGANPNIITKNGTGDAPLHHTAARGMTDMVDVIVGCPSTNVNLYNAAGETPLLCAVKYHRRIEEASQVQVDNNEVISSLLKAGADPKLPERSLEAKTVIHYAVEKMDPELFETIQDHVSPEVMRMLVNRTTSDNSTPLQLVHTTPISAEEHGYLPFEREDELRLNMYNLLLQAGAGHNMPQKISGARNDVQLKHGM